MAEKETGEKAGRADPMRSSILEAIRGRIASLNVVSVLADDTDCYGKNSPGDAYAKNKCSVDLTGSERVLPPFTAAVFGQQMER
jgi:hypothetical protein